MSVAEQTATRNKLDALMRQPLHTLQNDPLTAGGFSGNDTYVEDALSFSFNNAKAAVGPSLWVTTRKTGCSVLILDWGGLFSMV